MNLRFCAKPNLNLTVFHRYNTIIFWVYTDPVTLNKRLDDRVMKMIEVNMNWIGMDSWPRSNLSF